MIDIAQPRKTLDTTIQAASSELQQVSLMAGTSNGLWILDAQPRIELEGLAVNAIAPHAGGVWAIADHHSIWHRQPNGEWHPVATCENLRLNCLLPIADTVLVGTSEAHLMQLVEGHLQRIDSFDQAETREDWYTPWGGLPDVRSLAVGSQGERYVNIHVGGILRSIDQGKSWQPTLDLHADVHEVRTVSDRPGWVVAAAAEGLAISRDGGDTWEFDQAQLHATYARAVAVCGDTLFMSVSTGPRGSQSTLYRRPLDRPGTFEKCDRGLPEWFSHNINTKCLDTAGLTTAFGTQEGQIFYSTDAGLNWNAIAVDLAPVQCLSLTVIG